MSHFAKVLDGVVVNVIVAEPEFFDQFVDDSPGQWIKTSYNMEGGVYFNRETNLPAEDQSIIDGDEARQRKNFAVMGGTYDASLDAFIPPKPYDNWVLNTETCLWEAPHPKPDDQYMYYWNPDLDPNYWIRAYDATQYTYDFETDTWTGVLRLNFETNEWEEYNAAFHVYR